ncbi:alpha/beta fold hydrolase [Streptosporangium sp. NPDC000563]|uniref:thioesterase II family protein n=1 Tax=Streptosporangium sp. NPDC000563 TaxID=3154366 RepID=UPI00332E41D1
MTDHFIDGGPWIRRFHPEPGAAIRLVCFPHAGGAASFFFPVSRDMSPEVEVLSVQYPGRQDRRADPNIPDMEKMADQVAEALTPFTDRPFALFGHSMGATLAYEVTRRLRASNRHAMALFVSGRRAPHRVIDDGLHLLPNDMLVDDVMALEGTGGHILDNPELRDMLLAAIRSDYRAAETYRYVPGPPLRCPIHALTGLSDPRVAAGELHHWGEHTEGAFDIQVFSGGHFYLTENQPAVIQVIAERLSRATTSR